MPKLKPKPPVDPLEVKVKVPQSIYRQIAELLTPCPGCGRAIGRRYLVPYKGREVCVGCFVEATERAMAEARRNGVPFYLRARRYAAMANGWRMKRRKGCGCG